MHRKLIIVLFCLAPIFGIAGKHRKIDSVLNIIDTSHNPLLVSLQYEKLQAYYRNKGLFDTSEYYLNLYIEHAKENRLPKKIAESFNFKAILNTHRGLTENAIEDYQNAILAYEKIQDTAKTIAILQNLSWAYKNSGQYQHSIDAAIKAIEYSKQYNQNTQIPELLANIGSAFEKLGRKDKMKAYTFEALLQSKKTPNINPRTKPVIYNQLGNVYDNEMKYDSALHYYQECYKEAQNINWLMGKSIALGNIAMVYEKTGNNQKSIEVHFRSLKLEQKAGNTSGIISEYHSIASLYKKSNQLKKALNLALKTDSILQNKNLIKQEADNKKLLSEIYEQTGHPTKALIFYKKYHALMDSISGKAIVEQANELEAKYQNKVKSNEIKILTQENALKDQNLIFNRSLVLFLIIILILGALATIFILKWRKKRAEAQKADLQQRLLQSQMNPHFLFNAMEAIQSFMIHNDTKEASLYLTEFARLTRSVITHTREEIITLENEIEALTSYLKLQQLLKNNTFQFNILLDEDLEPEFMYIPPMLIQPFIENAIKHGLKDQMQNGKIELRITDRKNSIDVELTDNGVGYESSPKKKNGHISYAMQIFEERRRIIRQNTGKNIKFTIENMTQKGHENGTRIFLNIPVFES